MLILRADLEEGVKLLLLAVDNGCLPELWEWMKDWTVRMDETAGVGQRSETNWSGLRILCSQQIIVPFIILTRFDLCVRPSLLIVSPENLELQCNVWVFFVFLPCHLLWKYPFQIPAFNFNLSNKERCLLIELSQCKCLNRLILSHRSDRKSPMIFTTRCHWRHDFSQV